MANDGCIPEKFQFLALTEGLYIFWEFRKTLRKCAMLNKKWNRKHRSWNAQTLSWNSLHTSHRTTCRSLYEPLAVMCNYLQAAIRISLIKTRMSLLILLLMAASECGNL